MYLLKYPTQKLASSDSKSVHSFRPKFLVSRCSLLFFYSKKNTLFSLSYSLSQKKTVLFLNISVKNVKSRHLRCVSFRMRRYSVEHRRHSSLSFCKNRSKKNFILYSFCCVAILIGRLQSIEFHSQQEKIFIQNALDDSEADVSHRQAFFGNGIILWRAIR